MNFIKQFNAFFERTEFAPISGNAVLLWCTLFYIANRKRWPREFPVDNATLSMRSGLAIKPLQRARAELARGGYIIYKKGYRRIAPPKYSMPVLYKCEQYEHYGGDSNDNM